MVGSDRRDREVVEMAGLLHDVGKIGIPESILNKPANLTDEETEVIKRHPLLGERIVMHIKHPYIDEVADAVRAHHELWDGSGYPRQLKGGQIPLVSRILSICDTYDAMTSDRAYRQALDPAEAIRRIRAASSTRFDPDLVEAFADIAERGLLELDMSDSRYIASQYPDPMPDDEENGG
jgi:HD-GYP domain-containing protein (c-di-GMP phosphodiesterase class II)